jgi:hypothetical protein
MAIVSLELFPFSLAFAKLQRSKASGMIIESTKYNFLISSQHEL